MNKLGIPIAIVAAGAIIAGAIIFTQHQAAPATQAATTAAANISIAPISATDHILGNPKAKLVIVEYSDPECPFCKVFHATMHQIMDQYGANGSVAWLYRHF